MRCGLFIIQAFVGLYVASIAVFPFKKDIVQLLEVAPKAKLASAILVPLLMVIRGLRKRSLSPSGCVMGFIVASILTLGQWGFMFALLTFFLTSSKATRFREHLKRKIEGQAFKAGGQRDWIQVFCNGGVASHLSLLYLYLIGPTDVKVNFEMDYQASVITTAVLGAISCSCGDTWASELGSVLAQGSPRLITTLRTVPKGTNGGVSAVGLLVSVGGGFTVGFAFALGATIGTGFEIATVLKLVLLGGLCGLLGSLLDSLLGAVLQYSGQSRAGPIIETYEEGAKHISGTEFLDNHSVNLLSGLLTAMLAPFIAVQLF